MPTSLETRSDASVNVITNHVAGSVQPRFNWRRAAIVAALCFLTAFLFEIIASELVTQEVITVIGVTAIFLLVLGFCAARSRALAERPKWFIFSIWGLLLASEEIFSFVNDATNTYESQFAYAAYAEAAIWILAAIALLIFLLGNPNSLRGMFSGSYRWVSLFAMIALLSVAYAPQFAFSLAWAFKLCLVVIVLQACSKQMLDLDDISAFLVATIVVYLFLVAAPSVRSMMPDPTGTYGQNEFETRMREGPTGLSGAAGTLALLGLMTYTAKKRKALLLISLVGLVVMIVAGGKAAIAAGIMSGMLFFVLQKRIAAMAGFLAGIVVLFVLALMFTPLNSYMVAYLRSGQAMDLTGRVQLWIFVWPAIVQKFIIGHGYVSSRFVSIAMPGTPFQAGHMHNGFMEALYNNGILGLFAVLMVHLAIVRNLYKAIRGGLSQRARQLSIGCGAVYANLLINGMFNATFSGRANAPFMMLLALVVISSRLVREVQSPGVMQGPAPTWA